MCKYLQSKLSAVGHYLADCLQRYLSRLSTRTIWIYTFIFFICSASLLCTLVVVTWRSPGTYLSIRRISFPAYALQPQPVSIDSLRQQAILHHLQRLQYQIDSLRTHPDSKSMYDSLARLHPGLLDSLVQAQNLFLHPFTFTP